MNTSKPISGEPVGFAMRIISVLEETHLAALTIGELAHALGLEERSLIRAIKPDQDLRMLLKVYPGRSAEGELLLTTKQRFYRTAPLRTQLVDMFASHRVSLDDVV